MCAQRTAGSPEDLRAAPLDGPDHPEDALVPGQRRRERGAATKLIPRTRIPWADLLKRVFSIEILRCVRCGGWREVMGGVKDPLAARKILEHLGMDTEAYEPLPARAPPQLDLAL